MSDVTQQLYDIADKLGITTEEVDALVEEIPKLAVNCQVSGELAGKTMQKILRILEDKK